MGRMLETLKLGEGRRAPLPVSKPVAAAPGQDCVVEWEIGAEAPFVEVGGPNKKVELSPDLMKHPPQPMPSAPHLPVESAPLTAKAKAVTLTPTAPMKPAYEAWPAPAPMPTNISSEIIAYHEPDHVTSKEYAALLETMCRGLKADSGNVLLLLGLRPGVGASTVVLNLAACAAVKSRVVVVDANLRHAALAAKLGHADAPGLVELLQGTLALEPAVIPTGIGTLHLLAAGTPTKTTKLLTGHALSWLTSWLRDRYDLILIHGPTLEETADLALHVPHADGIYLVQPQGETASHAKAAAQAIGQMGGRLCGLIHTQFGG